MPTKRIAIAGLGEIGRTVARKLAQGLPGLSLAAIVTRDRAKARAWLDRGAVARGGARCQGLEGCVGACHACRLPARRHRNRRW